MAFVAAGSGFPGLVGCQESTNKSESSSTSRTLLAPHFSPNQRAWIQRSAAISSAITKLPTQFGAGAGGLSDIPNALNFYRKAFLTFWPLLEWLWKLIMWLVAYFLPRSKALSTDDIAAKLSDITVYCITNSHGQPILATGVPETQSQVAFIFFDRSDADRMFKRLSHENPDVAKGAMVRAVSLREIYLTFVGYSKNNKSKGSSATVVPQFFPKDEEVAHAMRLMSAPGKRIQSFSGVPVFQAEGLVLSSENGKQVPIFFCKKDLDNLWQEMRQKNPSIRKEPLIQVGTMEMMLMEMETSQEDDWKSVIFIPPSNHRALPSFIPTFLRNWW